MLASKLTAPYAPYGAGAIRAPKGPSELLQR